jgi:hypothetical protein
MSQAATAASAQPAAKLQPVGINQGIIAGRISHSRRETSRKSGEVFFLTIVKTKAADEYSYPGTVELSSASKIGNPGDDINVRVEITGFPRSYDKQTGPHPEDTESIQTATISLRVVE